MSHLGCPAQNILLEVESPKYEHCYQDFHVNVAPHEVSLADEKVQLHFVDGMTTVKKLSTKMVELAIVTNKTLILPLHPPLNLATP